MKNKKLPPFRTQATLLSVAALFGLMSGCGQPPAAAPTVPQTSSTGAAVTQTNEECRVPSDAVQALTGNYRATVKTSIYGTVQMDWTLTAETITGYSGQFLKSTLSINGSRGSSTSVALLCTLAVRNGSVLQGARLQSEATSFVPFDYIYSGGQLRTDHQMALSPSGGGTYRFDASQSWMVFKTTDLSRTLSATVSGLQKL